jgi:hypothetical protein
MGIQFDEKGKFFTPVITKEPVPVIIQTVLHRITGNFYVRPEERIKDELDRAEVFLAITDATISDLNGQEIFSGDFITVNRHHIIWILPVADLKKSQEP